MNMLKFEMRRRRRILGLFQYVVDQWKRIMDVFQQMLNKYDVYFSRKIKIDYLINKNKSIKPFFFEYK
jgi:hypothetical protein